MPLFSASSLLPVIIVVVIALFSARLMVRNTAATDSHEFAAIDGLRGFLALLVFIHHSIYWFSYAKTGKWSFFSSSLFMNFGHASVSLFFMLTGFLFFIKLIDARKKEIDWLRLYCSRILRLTPLYILLCLGIFTLVAFNSHFIAYEPTANIFAQMRDWLLFVIPGHPDINNHIDTHLIPAGVIWTLPYEWYFYLMLPLLALLLGSTSKSTSGIWLILSVLCFASFNYWPIQPYFLLPFVSGAIAAFIVRTPWLREQLSGQAANLVATLCLVIGYACFEGNVNIARLTLFTTAFALIACGADLFGALVTRSARALSTISYGVYLLHGITLYVVFHYVVPQSILIDLPIEHYWLFIFCVTPLLIAIASLSWHFIEWPAINSSNRLTCWIRAIRSASDVTAKAPYTPIRMKTKYSSRKNN